MIKYLNNSDIKFTMMMIKQYMNKNDSDYITIIFINILFYYRLDK